MGIGENIRRLRRAKGLSQEALGSALGVSGKAVSTWENGVKTPRMPIVERMAELFSVTVSELFGGEIPEGVDFALMSEAKSLTDEQKQSVIDYVRFLKSGGK